MVKFQTLQVKTFYHNLTLFLFYYFKQLLHSNKLIINEDENLNLNSVENANIYIFLHDIIMHFKNKNGK